MEVRVEHSPGRQPALSSSPGGRPAGRQTLWPATPPTGGLVARRALSPQQQQQQQQQRVAFVAPLPDGPSQQPPSATDWPKALEARLADFRQELERSMSQRFFALEARLEATNDEQLKLVRQVEDAAAQAARTKPSLRQDVALPMALRERMQAFEERLDHLSSSVEESLRSLPPPRQSAFEERRSGSAEEGLRALRQAQQAFEERLEHMGDSMEESLRPLRLRQQELSQKVGELHRWRQDMEDALQITGRGSSADAPRKQGGGSEENPLSVRIGHLIGELKEVLPSITEQQRQSAKHGADIEQLFGKVEALELLLDGGAAPRDRPKKAGPSKKDDGSADTSMGGDASKASVLGDSSKKLESRVTRVTVQVPDSTPVGSVLSVPLPGEVGSKQVVVTKSMPGGTLALSQSIDGGDWTVQADAPSYGAAETKKVAAAVLTSDAPVGCSAGHLEQTGPARGLSRCSSAPQGLLLVRGQAQVLTSPSMGARGPQWPPPWPNLLGSPAPFAPPASLPMQAPGSPLQLGRLF